MIAASTMHLLLRAVGASLLALALLHVVLWRVLKWTEELTKLTPLTARVFSVHLFFVVFVLVALGLLALGRPDLLVARSDLARLLLYAIVAFWAARLLAQPLVFDPVLALGSSWRLPLRLVAFGGWSFYLLVFSAALFGQL